MADIDHPVEADDAELAQLDRELKVAKREVGDGEVLADDEDDQYRYHESGARGQDDQAITPPG